MQYLYAWSLNQPGDLARDLAEFFAGKEEPRDYFAFAEQLIHGAIEKMPDVDARIRALAENWDFDRIAKIDLAILRLAIFEMLFRKDIPPVVSIMPRSWGVFPVPRNVATRSGSQNSTVRPQTRW